MNCFLLLTSLLSFCFLQPSVHKADYTKYFSANRKSSDGNPSAYFSKHVIPADTEIINHNDSSTSTFKIGSHQIKWQRSEMATFISIDKYKFEVSHQVTFNNVSGSQRDSLRKGYVLYEAKLYTYKDKEILGFEFGSTPCNGFACRLDYQLFYEINTTHLNFFGEYNTGNNVDLYSFADSDELSFISTSYDGAPWGEDTCHFEYTLYSLSPAGLFVKEKDQNDHDYFMRTKCANFYGGCKIESENWFEPIE